MKSKLLFVSTASILAAVPAAFAVSCSGDGGVPSYNPTEKLPSISDTTNEMLNNLVEEQTSFEDKGKNKIKKAFTDLNDNKPTQEKTEDEILKIAQEKLNNLTQEQLQEMLILLANHNSRNMNFTGEVSDTPYSKIIKSKIQSDVKVTSYDKATKMLSFEFVDEWLEIQELIKTADKSSVKLVNFFQKKSYKFENVVLEPVVGKVSENKIAPAFVIKSTDTTKITADEKTMNHDDVMTKLTEINYLIAKEKIKEPQKLKDEEERLKKEWEDRKKANDSLNKFMETNKFGVDPKTNKVTITSDSNLSHLKIRGGYEYLSLWGGAKGSAPVQISQLPFIERTTDGKDIKPLDSYKLTGSGSSTPGNK